MFYAPCRVVFSWICVKGCKSYSGEDCHPHALPSFQFLPPAVNIQAPRPPVNPKDIAAGRIRASFSSRVWQATRCRPNLATAGPWTTQNKNQKECTTETIFTHKDIYYLFFIKSLLTPLLVQLLHLSDDKIKVQTHKVTHPRLQREPDAGPGRGPQPHAPAVTLCGPRKLQNLKHGCWEGILSELPCTLTLGSDYGPA